MDPEERRIHALDFLLDYSKGTLWWVSNKIWNDVIPGFVWKKGSDAHPGLSVCRDNVEGLYSKIPMLIGTSRPCCSVKRCLTVRHISPECSDHYDSPSYFRVLRPYGLRFDEFGREGRIAMNATKPRLELDEARKLDEMLKWEGLCHG